MRRVVCAVVFLLVCPIAFAQKHHHGAVPAPGGRSPCAERFTPAAEQPAQQKVKWPVTTTSAKAQLFFNQGMTEYYGFNYEEAMRNFRTAKKLDAQMPMAWWGIALAAGPNINLGMDTGCRKVAVDEISAAVVKANQVKLTSVEHGLINALALRYAGPLTETVAYSVAMHHVWLTTTKADSEKGANVANVGALYAESLLEMRPWGLYDAAYRPALDTETINRVLITSIEAEDDAIGANHFYIHAAEASSMPRCALESAELLQKRMQTPEGQPQLQAPGHLVHMPSHIYLRLGDYVRAMTSNTDAAKADRDQYEKPCAGTFADYNKSDTCPQLYYGHYLSHNLFFRTVAMTFSGHSKEALESARETHAHAQHFVANEPELQRYMTAPLMTLVMNQEWEVILKEQGPPEKCSTDSLSENGCHILAAMWYWARGMAYAAGGSLPSASKAYDLMATEMALIKPPTPTGWGNNSALAMLAIAQSTLQAHFTWAGGQCNTGTCKVDGLNEQGRMCGQCQAVECTGDQGCLESMEQAIEHLKLAVTHEDALVYDEPPQWFPPTREALGGAYLRIGQFDDRRALEMYALAEKTFDEEILRHPGSGRALYGKWRAVRGQAGDEAAAPALTAFCNAWGSADYDMSQDELWPSGRPFAFNYPVTCPKKAVIPPPPGPRPALCKLKPALPPASSP